MINIIETSEYQLTVYIHTVDDKKKITLKVKNISKNKYYDIIIDNEYFENKNMFDIFKENINNIEEENVSVDFDENNIEIIIDTDNCKMTFTFTLKRKMNFL
jgi:superfamily II helicase